MKILTLTGPSCSGKTTLLNKLVGEHGFQNVVSHTTRPPRPGEEYGRDYYFASQQVFDIMKEENRFLENVSFNGYSYGVSVEEIEKAHKSGKIAALIVEPNGLRQIKQYAAKSKDLTVLSVYIDGELKDLMTRYLKRMAGEDLSVEEVAERHSKRLHSMIGEQEQWYPKEGSVMEYYYRVILDSYTPENETSVITTLNAIVNHN